MAVRINAAQTPTLIMISRTTTAALTGRGKSGKSAYFPSTSRARLAGHPGHAQEPNHASSVIPIPPSAAMNPRLILITRPVSQKPLDKSVPSAASFLLRTRTMTRRFLIAMAVLTTAFALPAAGQQRDLADALLGPLPVRDQYLLSNGYFFFEPEGARVLDEDSWVVDIHSADSNTFAKSRWVSHNLDGDTDRRTGAQTLSLIRLDEGTTIFL